MPQREIRENKKTRKQKKHLKDGGKRYIDKKKFFPDIGYTPHPSQWKIHDSGARYRMAACGVRWGKSLSAAYEALATLMYRDVRGWIVAPTYELTEKVFREVYRVSVEYLRDYIESESWSKKYIKFIWGSELYSKSADNPISLAGEALDFVIVDEAPAVKEEIWTHFLRQRITDRLGWVLFIGTPRGRNWYYNIFLRGQDPLEREYMSFHFTSYDNPYLQREEIEAARKEIPSRAFRQEYLAEFLSEADSVFRNIREQIRPTLKPPVKDRFYVGGVDLAKYQDFNVITIADYESNEVVYFDRWNRTDWTITYDRIAAALKKYNNAEVWVDSSGVGDPVFEALSKKPYSLRVKPFKFTNPSKEHLIDNLAWFFENRNIYIPEIPELINELEIFEYKMTASGKTTFNAPSGYHDDIVISLALTALGLRRSRRTVFSSINIKNL